MLGGIQSKWWFTAFHTPFPSVPTTVLRSTCVSGCVCAHIHVCVFVVIVNYLPGWHSSVTGVDIKITSKSGSPTSLSSFQKGG